MTGKLEAKTEFFRGDLRHVWILHENNDKKL